MTSIQPVYYSASLSSLFTSISAVFQHFSSPLSHSLQRPSAKCINFKKKEWQTLAQKNSEKNKFTQFASMYSRHCVILCGEFIPIFFFLCIALAPAIILLAKKNGHTETLFFSKWMIYTVVYDFILLLIVYGHSVFVHRDFRLLSYSDRRLLKKITHKKKLLLKKRRWIESQGIHLLFLFYFFFSFCGPRDENRDTTPFFPLLYIAGRLL